MEAVGTDEIEKIKKRIRLCDYLTVAELYLKDNYLLERELEPEDIKPRLLGHWGTCHGINVAYANLKAFFHNDPNFSFILGPGHGFPALQANLFIDGDLLKIDNKANKKEPTWLFFYLLNTGLTTTWRFSPSPVDSVVTSGLSCKVV